MFLGNIYFILRLSFFSDILTYFGEWTLGKRLFLFYVLHGLRRQGME